MSLELAAAALRRARRVAVLTGAGISAESGLATFRGPQDGLWSRFRAEALATPEAFAADPALVWAWYAWRRALVARARPNAGHLALVRLADLVPDFALVTQNVDGLHQAAGSRDVIALHGEIMVDRCSGCGRERAAEVRPELAEAPVERLEPPRCDRCGAYRRPAVVWFGEPLPGAALERALAAAAAAEVFLVVGTSGVVYPAASLAPLARDGGAQVVTINPEPAGTDVGLHLPGRSGDVLPALLSRAFGVE